MSGYHVVRDYPHSPQKIWRALTDPALVPLWTTAGRGGRPEGFQPVPGTLFRFVARPIRPFWDGIVRCEVLEVEPPRLLRYSWLGDESAQPSIVTCMIEPTSTGARLTWDHTALAGIDGRMMAKLLGRVRRNMLDDPAAGFPAVLKRLDDAGNMLEQAS
jgi:uncharacterized protein YndB with AHSA1/START domain